MQKTAVVKLLRFFGGVCASLIELLIEFWSLVFLFFSSSTKSKPNLSSKNSKTSIIALPISNSFAPKRYFNDFVIEKVVQILNCFLHIWQTLSPLLWYNSIKLLRKKLTNYNFPQYYTFFLLTFNLKYIILITEKVDKTNFTETRGALWKNWL